MIEKKMQRIEKAKEQEVSELKEKLEASQGDVRNQLKAKDTKITEVGGLTGGQGVGREAEFRLSYVGNYPHTLRQSSDRVTWAILPPHLFG